MSESEPFVFYTERRLVVLTGRRARNLSELRDHVMNVSGSCIFYHTHYLYLTQHFVRPRFYNEFANWASHALQEERLAEQLAAIDLLAMTTIRDIREAIVTTLNKHLDGALDNARQCPAGDDFHFCEAKSFFMPTGLIANNVADFFEHILRVTNASLHFHFFEARLRLERPANDFSLWLEAVGEPKLARRIDKLNPYAMTLQELKGEIARLGRKYVGR